MDESIDSLYNIGLRCCAQQPESFCDQDPVTGKYCLKAGLQLPSKICEDLLQARHDVGLALDDTFLHAFSDLSVTRLHNINLSCIESVSSTALQWLLAHEPTQLFLPTHTSVDGEITHNIGRSSKNLQVLHLAANDIYVASWGMPMLCKEAKSVNRTQSEPKRLKLNPFSQGGGKPKSSDLVFINGDKLKSFAVNRLPMKQENQLKSLLSTTPSLTHLDLSDCNLQLHLVDNITQLHSLTSLILHNVGLASHGSKAFEVIGQLTELRALDISSDRQEGRIPYRKPDELLRTLVEKLTHLEYLDISCTNLAQQSNSQGQGSSVAGLEGRHLEFLGLLRCDASLNMGRPSSWANLPAKKVSGDANLDQMIVAVEMYTNKPALLHLALLQLLRGSSFIQAASHQRCQQLLQVILTAMEKQPYHINVQMLATGVLYEVHRSIGNTDALTYKVKRRVVDSILNAIWRNHCCCPGSRSQLLRKAGMVLLRCKLPQEDEYLLRRLTATALLMVQTLDPNLIVETLGVCLVNRMSACETTRYKEIFGEMDGMKVVLDWLCDRRDHSGTEAEEKHRMWRTLWSLTDECHSNCERFIKLGGLDLIYRYAEDWAVEKTMLVELFGVAGNLVEVESVRPTLHCSRLIDLVRDNIEYQILDFELSNVACSTLAHLLVDGPDAWQAESVSREKVMEELTEVMSKWIINLRRDIVYRTFNPLLRLLTSDVTCGQFYAAWEISNVTQYQPDRYCKMVMDPSNGLLTIARDLVASPDCTTEVKDLLEDLLKLCEDHLSKPGGEEPQSPIKRPRRQREREDSGSDCEDSYSDVSEESLGGLVFDVNDMDILYNVQF